MHIEDANLSLKQHSFLTNLFEEAHLSGENIAKESTTNKEFEIPAIEFLKAWVDTIKGDENLRNASIGYGQDHSAVIQYLAEEFQLENGTDGRIGLYGLDEYTDSITIKQMDKAREGIRSGLVDWVRRQIMDLASKKLKVNKSNNTLRQEKDVPPTIKAFAEPDVDRAIRDSYPKFSQLDSDQKRAVLDVYNNYYEFGKTIVPKDMFNNGSNDPNMRILKDRYLNYSKIESLDEEFLDELSKGEEIAIEDILWSSDENSTDFGFDVYESDFLNKIPELSEEIDESLDKEVLEVVSELAYNNGVEFQVNDIAKEAIQEFAKESLEGIERIENK